MKENSIAKRYAAGLTKSIASEAEYREIKQELEEFLKLLGDIPEFKAGMETALLSHKQKIEILDVLHQKIQFKEKTYHFLYTVLDENRLIFLENMIEFMEDMWFEKNGIEKLKVYSAIPLNSTLISQLTNSLEKAFDKKIVLETSIDTSLIAGIKIQRGLIFYDFSIDGNLKKLKEVLLADQSASAKSAVGEH